LVTRKERSLRKVVRDRAEKRYEEHRRRNLVQAKPGELKFVIVLDNSSLDIIGISEIKRQYRPAQLGGIVY